MVTTRRLAMLEAQAVHVLAEGRRAAQAAQALMQLARVPKKCRRIAH